MSGDDGSVALREYFETLLDDHKRLDDERHALGQLAVDKAEALMNHRLEAMNEFRAALSDQSGRFLAMDTYDAKHEVLSNRIGQLEKTMANLEGRLWAIGAGMTVINVAINLAAFFLRK
jgi:hypothetical protein